MEASEFVWSEDRIAHIGRYSVEPEEFEEVCFGKALVLQAKSQGKNLSPCLRADHRRASLSL